LDEISANAQSHEKTSFESLSYHLILVIIAKLWWVLTNLRPLV